MILVPVGLILAFVGMVKQERPAKYCIIGFVLNMLWFAVPLFFMCVSVVF